MYYRADLLFFQAGMWYSQACNDLQPIGGFIDMHLIIPKDYNPVLNLRDTEIAIKLVKDFFEKELAKCVSLIK